MAASQFSVDVVKCVCLTFQLALSINVKSHCVDTLLLRAPVIDQIIFSRRSRQHSHSLRDLSVNLLLLSPKISHRNCHRFRVLIESSR